MRLDKFLCGCNLGTRSQIKKDIKAGLVTVNDQAARKPEQHINEKEDKVCYKGQICIYEPYVYYMLHKPAGVVSATEDQHDRTVLAGKIKALQENAKLLAFLQSNGINSMQELYEKGHGMIIIDHQ